MLSLLTDIFTLYRMDQDFEKEFDVRGQGFTAFASYHEKQALVAHLVVESTPGRESTKIAHDNMEVS